MTDGFPDALTQAECDELALAWNAGPLCTLFGFHTTFVPGEKVVVEMRNLHAGHRGGKGTTAVNGAVLAALFDYTLGCTPILHVPRRYSATVQLAIQFFRGIPGDEVRCEAHLDRLTSTMAFCTAHLFDGDGQRCGQCTGICSLGKPRTFDELKTALMAPR